MTRYVGVESSTDVQRPSSTVVAWAGNSWGAGKALEWLATDPTPGHDQSRRVRRVLVVRNDAAEAPNDAAIAGWLSENPSPGVRRSYADAEAALWDEVAAEVWTHREGWTLPKVSRRYPGPDDEDEHDGATVPHDEYAELSARFDDMAVDLTVRTSTVGVLTAALRRLVGAPEDAAEKTPEDAVAAALLMVCNAMGQRQVLAVDHAAAARDARHLAALRKDHAAAVDQIEQLEAQRAELRQAAIAHTRERLNRPDPKTVEAGQSALEWKARAEALLADFARRLGYGPEYEAPADVLGRARMELEGYRVRPVDIRGMRPLVEGETAAGDITDGLGGS